MKKTSVSPEPLRLNRDQIVCFAAPVKRDIVEALLQIRQASVNELAKHLNRSPKALYYHIKRLCEVELVQVIFTRRVAKRTESVYGLVADRFIVEEEGEDSELRRAQRRSFKALLRRVEREVVQAEETKEGVNLNLFRFGIGLKTEDMEEFHRKLQEAFRFARQRETDQGDIRLTLTAILISETLSTPSDDSESKETHSPTLEDRDRPIR